MRKKSGSFLCDEKNANGQSLFFTINLLLFQLPFFNLFFFFVFSSSNFVRSFGQWHDYRHLFCFSFPQQISLFACPHTKKREVEGGSWAGWKSGFSINFCSVSTGRMFIPRKSMVIFSIFLFRKHFLCFFFFMLFLNKKEGRCLILNK